jgi:twitching motility protein PilI
LEPLRPYLAGAYYHNDVIWTVFSPFRLAQSNEFFNAAAAS